MSKTQEGTDAKPEQASNGTKDSESTSSGIKVKTSRKMEFKERTKPISKFRGVSTSTSVNDVMSKFETKNDKEVPNKRTGKFEGRKDVDQASGKELNTVTDEQTSETTASNRDDKVCDSKTTDTKASNKTNSDVKYKTSGGTENSVNQELKDVKKIKRGQLNISDKFTTKHERNKTESNDRKINGHGAVSGGQDQQEKAESIDKQDKQDRLPDNEKEGCKKLHNTSVKNETVDDKQTTKSKKNSKAENVSKEASTPGDNTDTVSGQDSKVENKSPSVLKSEARLVMRLTPSPDRRSQTPVRIIVKTKGPSSETGKDINKTVSDSTTERQAQVKEKQLIDAKDDSLKTERKEIPYSSNELQGNCRLYKDSGHVGNGNTSEEKAKASQNIGRVLTKMSEKEANKRIKDAEPAPTTEESSNGGTITQENSKKEGKTTQDTYKPESRKDVSNGDGGGTKNLIAQWVITDQAGKESQTSRKFDMKKEVKSENKDACVSRDDIPLSKRKTAFLQQQSQNGTSRQINGCMEDVRKEIAGGRGFDEQDGDASLSTRLSAFKAKQNESMNAPDKGCMDDVRKEIAAQRGYIDEIDEDKSLGNLVSSWQKKADDHQLKQMINPFSDWSGASHRLKMSKDDENYGRPVEGSETERRGKEAENYIQKETEKMCEVIGYIGNKDEDGTISITFGKLFSAYETISDKIVGTLMRARKRQRVLFEGEMLYQNRDEKVVITLINATPSED